MIRYTSYNTNMPSFLHYATTPRPGGARAKTTRFFVADECTPTIFSRELNLNSSSAARIRHATSVSCLSSFFHSDPIRCSLSFLLPFFPPYRRLRHLREPGLFNLRLVREQRLPLVQHDLADGAKPLPLGNLAGIDRDR